MKMPTSSKARLFAGLASVALAGGIALGLAVNPAGFRLLSDSVEPAAGQLTSASNRAFVVASNLGGVSTSLSGHVAYFGSPAPDSLNCIGAPTPFAVGTCFPDQSITRTITVTADATNDAAVDVTGLSFLSGDDVFSLAAAPPTGIAPGNTANLFVRFDPAGSPGSYSGTYLIQLASGCAGATVTFTGDATPRGASPQLLALNMGLGPNIVEVVYDKPMTSTGTYTLLGFGAAIAVVASGPRVQLEFDPSPSLELPKFPTIHRLSVTSAEAVDGGILPAASRSLCADVTDLTLIRTTVEPPTGDLATGFLGTWFTTRDKVVDNGVLDAGELVIGNDNDEGIVVRDLDNITWATSFTLVQRVQISGPLANPNGRLELADNWILSESLGLDTPVNAALVPLSEVGELPAAEFRESMFARIEEDLTILAGPFVDAGGVDYRVGNGVINDFTVRFDADPFPIAPVLSLGDRFDFVQGITTQFDTTSPFLTDFKIQPRQVSDFGITTSVSDWSTLEY